MSLDDRGRGFEGCFRIFRHPNGEARGFLFCDLDIYAFLAPFGYYVILLEDLSLEPSDELLFRISRESRDWHLRFPSERDAQRFAKIWSDLMSR